MAKAEPRMGTNARARARQGLVERLPAPHFVYGFECRGPDGRLKWRESCGNLVTTEGKNSLGNVYFRGATQITSWYVGLKGAGTAAVGDTAASHAGWAEITDYDEAARQTLTLAAYSGGSASNVAALAVFNITATVTVDGAFVTSVSTKGGTTGVLYSVGSFSVARSLINGDEFTVTVTEAF
jgi:hypothetical protein